MQISRPAVLSRGLGIAIALVQLFDIAVHAATDQLEPLRVASNAIILLWLVAASTGRRNGRSVRWSVGSIGAYLLLNLIFLAVEGVANPNQGGELRVMLFALVILTVILSALPTFLLRRPVQE